MRRLGRAVLILVLSGLSLRVQARDYVQFSTQNSTSVPNEIVDSIEAYLSSESRDKKAPKKPYYSLDLTSQESYTPTTYQALNVPGTKLTSIPFSTTLYTNEYDLLYEYHRPSRWVFGLGFQYSRQQAGGTPNVFSELAVLEISKTSDMNPNQKPSSGESDEWIPTWEWKITATQGPIQADSYVVASKTVGGITELYPQGQVTITQTGTDLALTADAWEWLTVMGHFESYSYNNNPNYFQLLKSPKAGLPTSLNSYETGGEITWHISDDWDLEAKTNYSVAATSDSSITLDMTYTLTYATDDWELGVGYDQLEYTGAPDVDSSVVNLKMNF